MQSRTSCFNGTLFRKNLSRFWPLWGLASFVGALFPLALFLQLVRKHTAIAPLEMTGVYYATVSWVLPALTLCYAVLCAMTVWSYLYNARSVGLMHTLPIERQGLFFTNFLSGMAMMLIPYAVTGGLCVLVTLYARALDPVGLGITILAVVGESFFYFASATFVAFVTGNIFALPVLYFLLHFLAVLADFLVSSFAQGFLFGFTSDYTGVAEFLSPTVYLVHHLNTNLEYVDITAESGEYNRMLSAVTLENAWLIAVYALVGVVLLVLAYGAYRRRHSESAGDVMAVRWLRPVFRWGVTVLVGSLGGLLLYELFWRSFQYSYSSTYEALPMTVCLVIAGIIGYYAASMLLAKSLRVFRGSWKSLVAVVVLSAAFCIGMHTDVLGVECRVPELSQLRQLEVQVDGNTYTLTPGEDDTLIQQVRELHQTIVADEAYIREMNSDGPWPEDSDVSYGNALNLNYTLRSGIRVERFYRLTLTRERIAQDGTYDAQLDALVRSQTMKQKRLHLDDGFTPDGGSLYVEAQGQGYDLGSREATAILNAVAQDAAVGAWGDPDWFKNTDRDDYAMSLDLSFTRQGKNGTDTDWITITVHPGMNYTVACLKKLALVTEKDLLTNGQMYPDRYDAYEAEEDGIIDTAQVLEPEEHTVEAEPSADPSATTSVVGAMVLTA